MKLTYFGLYGRAEATRMCLAHAKVEFEDERLSFPEFGALKAAKGPSYQLPALEHDGLTMNQSMPILRYVGMQHGYYPMDQPKLCWAADATIEDNTDIFAKAPLMVFFGAEKATEEQVKLFEEAGHKYNKHLEAQLADGRKYLAGDKITIADFAIFAKIKSIGKNHSPEAVLNQNCLEVYAVMAKIMDDPAYPKVAAWIANMEAELADYLSARPPAPL